MDGVLEITSLWLCSNMLDLAFLSPINLPTALLLWYNKHPKDGVLSMKEIVAACKGGKKVLLS